MRSEKSAIGQCRTLESRVGSSFLMPAEGIPKGPPRLFEGGASSSADGMKNVEDVFPEAEEPPPL